MKSLVKPGLWYFCQIGKLSKNFKAKSSTIVKKKLGLTAIQYNCQKKLTAAPYNCQKEIIGHSHPVKLSNCILEWFLQENTSKSRVWLIKFNTSRLWPYSTIVKNAHSHTVQLSNYISNVSKGHGHTVQLSKKFTAIQYNCQTLTTCFQSVMAIPNLLSN